MVFATLRPEQINLGRTGARGVIDFKHFLEFADRGARAIAESFAPTGRDVEAPFEHAVKRALEAKGWVVHPQIGVSFFRVDLGVVHPDFPGRYLAGVECDGATYHRSATARDRDRLREMVLTDLGWRIRRIWSTEWWMDAASALEKIHLRLVGDLEADRLARTIVPPELPAADDPITPEEMDAPPRTDTEEEARAVLDHPEPANVQEPETVPSLVYASRPEAQTLRGFEDQPQASLYLAADPAAVCAPDRSRFHDQAYQSELRQMVDHVISVEGPIFFDVLVERVSRAPGFQRAKDLIRGSIRAALGRNRYEITLDAEREVIWPKDTAPTFLPPFRGAGIREHADIPLPELASLALSLRRRGFDDQEVVRGMQEHFKLGRLAAGTRDRFEAAVRLSHAGGWGKGLRVGG